ncbi:hypothetical protein [Paeniglutamicibacter kerguelensis]|uniref:Uncharacterized protein n=1 Tax=Paeniglutamicibacter kerguelensis TaxID=254788 RepID=A0ABS4X8X5_9MICC|nr:hypothetical protein [Paeniglutamicibacter kerguelensis]MBP2384761.1 hypothetical protein [Paeniglutamicibacter kerguelensis]
MKTFARSVMAVTASLSIALSGVAVASAAPVAPPSAVNVVAATKAPPVSIKRIPTKVVKGPALATIKPLVGAAKGVKVTSKVLTVKQGRKTLVNKRTSATLRAGTYAVTTTVRFKAGSKSFTAAKTQTLVVKRASSKGAWPMSNGNSCPTAYPIKGNRTGSNLVWKYHVPGGRYYNITNPEECFKSAADAIKAGYRASME